MYITRVEDTIPFSNIHPQLNLYMKLLLGCEFDIYVQCVLNANKESFGP